MKTTAQFKSKDGLAINYYSWLPEEKPVAVLQIAHGMAEHADRYDDFAQFLNENKIAVYANDHRGHGKTAPSKKDLGYFAKEGGWMKVVDDMRVFTELIRTEHQDLPVFLLGHSMGSFLVRTYITKYDDINGVILSGTAANPPAVLNAGKMMTAINLLFKKGTKASKFFDNMSFGSFNKAFKKEGPMAWLSRDKKEVRTYNNDPYCGFICSLKFFQDLFWGLSYISKDKNNQHIRFTLPIYVIAGSKDPVGNNGEGPRKVANHYRHLNLEQVEFTLYRGARHEILNEINHQEVYKDILDWITFRI
ncbi:MAG: lysophospholipase [Candidatus Neomarinimicrobiota bacterium]